MPDEFIVDAHLDLAYNALRGREVLRSAVEQVGEPDDIPTVGLPDLRAGRVGLICATIYCEPCIVDGKPGYRNAEEAHSAGCAQLRWYQNQFFAGTLRSITRRADLADFQLADNSTRDPAVRIDGAAGSPSSSFTSAILLLEGADPIRTPSEAAWWFAQGVRIVGMAWKRTRYCGGTGAPGPLTPDGVELVKSLDRLGIIHDASHLAEESFWQLLDLTTAPVIASHSNCRAFVPTDRQLSDEMIGAIVGRGGVIGINFFDRFLVPHAPVGVGSSPAPSRRAMLADVVDHVKHICDIAGSAGQVGIGTDMDGGLGRDQIPVEIETSGDLPKVAEALGHDGFSDAEIRGIMGDNWVRFFSRNLPA